MARQDLSPPSTDSTPPVSTWDEWLIPRLMQWRMELAGALLVVIAVFTCLGLLGLAGEATLAALWADWVRRLTGWGAYALALLTGVGGGQLVLRRTPGRYRIQPQQILGLELVLSTLLPVTHWLTGADFTAADLGQAGGLLGWALAAPVANFLGPVLTTLLYLSSLAAGAALMAQVRLEDVVRWLVYTSGHLRRWADELASDPDSEPVRVIRPTTRPARLRLVETSQPTSQGRSPLLPPLNLLQKGQPLRLSPAEAEHNRTIIEKTLQDFGLVGRVVEIRQGPTITQFGVEPGYVERPGPDGQPRAYKVRVMQIARLRADLALALAVPRLRIEAPIPGRGLVGIEVPNAQAAPVYLRDVLESDVYRRLQAPLAVGLGESVSGEAYAIDLARMPHLLIAGATGTGKSVCIKTLIASLIIQHTPDQLQLILIDPKRVEMLRFNGLPHLVGPVEVEGERIVGVLRWLVAEMERRYELFEALGARQLRTYNIRRQRQGEAPLPYIVVLIDELADLMVQYSAEVERTLCRLAQMARATGIHLVVATQRPSTDVLTGLIKANFPARISFAVASSVDSRVILDHGGAEQLLGNGDMLFLSSDASMPVRLQGCLISDEEVEALAAYWQKVSSAAAQPAPWESLLARINHIEETDDLLEQAIALCQKHDTLSISLLQRRLRVGFPRAARLMETLYEMDLVEDPKTGGRTRRTHITNDDDDPLGNYLTQRSG